MNYVDTDTTQTDWSEFALPGETERCPITGVSTRHDYLAAGYADDVAPESETRPNAKLEAMFDKFLYRK